LKLKSDSVKKWQAGKKRRAEMRKVVQSFQKKPKKQN